MELRCRRYLGDRTFPALARFHSLEYYESLDPRLDIADLSLWLLILLFILVLNNIHHLKSFSSMSPEVAAITPQLFLILYIM